MTIRTLRRIIACALLLLIAPLALYSDTPQPLYPLAVAVTAEGTVFIADRNLPGIWKLVDGKPVLYFQGSKKFRTPLNAVRCLAVDREGHLLAGDSSTREIYRFDDQGQPQPLTKGGVGIPMAIAVDGEGNIWAADIEIHRIVKIPAAGGEATIIAEVPAPRGLAFDNEGRLLVVSHGKDQLIRLSADGKTREVVVSGQPWSFPHQIVLDEMERAYITDGYAKAVWKVTFPTAPEKLLEGAPLDNPVGIARRGTQLLVVDPRANKLFEISLDGMLTSTIPLGASQP